MLSRFACVALCSIGVANASPIIVDVNSRVIGFYQGVGTQSSEEYGVSPTGYRFGFDRETGRLLRPEGIYTNDEGQVFFTTTDCTGQAFIPDHPGVKPGVVIPGAYPEFPIQASGPLPLYYLPQAARPPAQSVTKRSFWNYSGAGQLVVTCFNGMAPQQRNGIPLLPNNPTETSVPNEMYLPPLRILSSWLFRDGFEAPLSKFGGNFSESYA